MIARLFTAQTNTHARGTDRTGLVFPLVFWGLLACFSCAIWQPSPENGGHVSSSPSAPFHHGQVETELRAPHVAPEGCSQTGTRLSESDRTFSRPTLFAVRGRTPPLVGKMRGRISHQTERQLVLGRGGERQPRVHAADSDPQSGRRRPDSRGARAQPDSGAHELHVASEPNGGPLRSAFQTEAAGRVVQA